MWIGLLIAAGCFFLLCSALATGSIKISFNSNNSTGKKYDKETERIFEMCKQDVIRNNPHFPIGTIMKVKSQIYTNKVDVDGMTVKVMHPVGEHVSIIGRRMVDGNYTGYRITDDELRSWACGEKFQSTTYVYQMRCLVSGHIFDTNHSNLANFFQVVSTG